jgi:hypothetical protein
MAISFEEIGHEYTSNDGENINWLSVTAFIAKFKGKFDALAQAKKSSKNKYSKWYKMDPLQIVAIWEAETTRAITLGNWYHGQREKDILDFQTIERNGVVIPIIKPINKNGVKLAPDQKLKDGMYPEHMVYLKSLGLCGQSDLVEIVNGTVNITDYKTNKEIRHTGYTNWEGITSKMYNPISHLDDCHINHYNLQLSIYAYIIKKHNPQLNIGKLTIQHVTFKETGKDENGYPLTEMKNGEPVIDEIKMYDLPYLKDEVISLVMWLKDNLC